MRMAHQWFHSLPLTSVDPGSNHASMQFDFRRFCEIVVYCNRNNSCFNKNLPKPTQHLDMEVSFQAKDIPIVSAPLISPFGD